MRTIGAHALMLPRFTARSRTRSLIVGVELVGAPKLLSQRLEGIWTVADPAVGA